MSYHSVLQYSVDIAKFLANFLRRIVKKMGQKLILEYNFINKNSDDFMYYNFAFLTFLDWIIKNSQKMRKTSKMEVFHNFWLFFIVKSKHVKKAKL